MKASIVAGEPPPTATQAGGGIATARGVLWVMFAINFLNYLDRFILPAVAPKIKAEFGISDTQLGALATAFTLVYGVAALPFGVWADRGIRKNIVAIGVGIWSVATLLSGAVANAGQLYAARAVLGVGEAGYYPAGTSLLVDYVPRERRAWVMGIWNVGASVGAAVGFALGGLVADHYGWRAAFYMTAVPGLICAVLAWRIREPRRGASDGAAKVRPAPPIRESVRAILGIRTMRVAIASQTLNFFVLGAAAFWFPTLLQRRFAISLGTAGLISGAVLVLSGIIGTLGGGWLADRLLARYPSARLLVTGAGFLISAPLLIISLLMPSLALTVPIFFLGGIFLNAYNGPMTALMQDVVRPELRCATVAVSLIVAHVLGDAFSPLVLGALSDSLGDLNRALELTLAPVILLAGLVALRGLRGVDADVRAATAG